MRLRVTVLAVALAFGLVLLGRSLIGPHRPPSAGPCLTSCQGCCTPDGVCHPGTSGERCGQGGLACAVCGPGERCRDGRCARIQVDPLDRGGY